MDLLRRQFPIWKITSKGNFMNIVFTHTAWKQYVEWQREDKKIVKRINELIKDSDRNCLLNGVGKPEPLKYCKACSRRITDEH